MIAQKNGVDVYTISSPKGLLKASFVPEKGGTGSSLIATLPNGEKKECLFLHDFFWEKDWHDLAGGWPFLFPICARLERDGKAGRYLYDGHYYELPIHGFSWWLPWEVLKSEKENQLTMRLKDNKKTWAIYPFSFEVTLVYTIEDDRLICEHAYKNTGKNNLPYYAGFHPYFLTPKGNEKSSVILDYEPVRRYCYNDKLTDIIGEQPLFKTPISVTDSTINEQLTLVGANKKIALHYPNNFSLTLEEQSDLLPYVQLYTMSDKPFFCVEPWMSFPNAMNTVEGVRILKPGESEKGLLMLQVN